MSEINRTLVISDIHGCCNEFNELLKQSQYDPSQDKLILLGDYVDRGYKSKDIVEQVKNLHEEWGVVVLRGNHDQMMLDALIKDDDANWLHNGALSTLQSYCGLDWFINGLEWDAYVKAKEFILKNYLHHIEFIQRLPLFHEDDSHIYVHAGLHPLYEDWKKQPDQHYIWIRDIFFNNPTSPTVDKTVVFGHTPVVTIHESADVWFDGDKIGVDGGCAYGYQLNCLEIREDGYEMYCVKRNKSK